MMKTQKRELELEESSAKAKMEKYQRDMASWILRWKHWKNRSEKREELKETELSEMLERLEMKNRNIKTAGTAPFGFTEQPEDLREGLHLAESHGTDRTGIYLGPLTLRTRQPGTLNGKRKIELETYVQMAYFDRILRRANIRLMTMSSGQYELKRSETSGNKRTRADWN